MLFPTTILKQFYNSQDVEKINNSILEHLKNPTFVNDAGWATYYSVGEEVDAFLNSTLPKLENETLCIHYYVSPGTSGPHSDKGYTNKGRTFIMPLATYNSYTIVFDQIQEIGVFNDKFFNSAPNVKVDSFANTSINLSHLSPGQTTKLTIETEFYWNCGDILIFDRKKIHCSDYFIANHPTPKKGIVIWSEVN